MVCRLGKGVDCQVAQLLPPENQPSSLIYFVPGHVVCFVLKMGRCFGIIAAHLSSVLVASFYSISLSLSSNKSSVGAPGGPTSSS